MKTARLALIAVILTAGSLFAIAQLSPLMFQRDIDQLTDVPVAGRIEQSRALLKQPLEFEQAKKVLDQVKAAAYHHDDPQELVDFFVEVGESNESAALRAAAFRNAASTLHERFRNDDALVFYKRALELQPTRNNEEWIKKLDLAYQIAQEEWYEGRWENALTSYLQFSINYSETVINSEGSIVIKNTSYKLNKNLKETISIKENTIHSLIYQEELVVNNLSNGALNKVKEVLTKI